MDPDQLSADKDPIFLQIGILKIQSVVHVMEYSCLSMIIINISSKTSLSVASVN